MQFHFTASDVNNFYKIMDLDHVYQNILAQNSFSLFLYGTICFYFSKNQSS